jgi:hypothetical protein
MTRRLILLFGVVLATGLIVAGCGDDDDDDGTTDASPATTQESGGGGDTDTTEVPTTGDEDADGAIQQAVEACKGLVNATPQLSADAKSDLQERCEGAESGDIDEVREATSEACETIVEQTIPEGAAREQALSACESVVP